MEFLASVRFKDGTKLKYKVSGESHTEAREALMEIPDIAVILIAIVGGKK